MRFFGVFFWDFASVYKWGLSLGLTQPCAQQPFLLRSAMGGSGSRDLELRSGWRADFELDGGLLARSVFPCFSTFQQNMSLAICLYLLRRDWHIFHYQMLKGYCLRQPFDQVLCKGALPMRRVQTAGDFIFSRSMGLIL